eukprot:3459090-Prymnesium_polylepis.1
MCIRDRHIEHWLWLVPGKTLWRPEQLLTCASGHPSHAGHFSTCTPTSEIGDSECACARGRR